MRALLLTFLFLSALRADVMFTLTNIETSHIFVANQSSLLDKNDVIKIKGMMKKSLSSIGLKSEGRDGDTLMMKIESASIKGSHVVHIKLALASDVITSRKEGIETFALTYDSSDMIESDEDVKSDIFESAQFLLSEFVEHYKEDN